MSYSLEQDHSIKHAKGEIVQSASPGGCHRTQSICGKLGCGKSPTGMIWLRDVLCAAISGWLLVVAQAVTDYAIVHLCALLPFFWRVLFAERRRAALMGVVLATAFVVVSADRTGSVLHVGVVELIVLNLLFALYGLALSRARSVFGTTPLLLIFLWLPLEVSQNHLETLNATARFGFDFGDHAVVFFSLPNAALVIALALALYALLLTIACFLIVLTCSRFRGRDNNQGQFWGADWMPALVRRRYELPGWRSPPEGSDPHFLPAT